MFPLFFFIGVSTSALQASQPEPLEILSWFSPDNYPPEALRVEAEGTVAFQVEVDADGKPGRCIITSSSGHPSLDNGTCDIVRESGRFRPAVGAEGKAVPSTFTSRVSWKMPASAPPSYRAVVIDFLGEEATPQCRVEAKVIPPEEAQSCAGALRHIALQPEIARALKRITFLLVSSGGDDPPFQPDPSWGERLSRLVSEQAYLRGSHPVTCTTVVAEGLSKGADACAGFPGGKRRLTAAEAAVARISRVETSILGVPRD